MSRPNIDCLETPPEGDDAKELFVFVDTEFSSFSHPELISIGLVAANTKDQLYLEVAEARELVISEFVREVVYPLLGTCGPEILPYSDLAKRLEAWFDELRGGEKAIRIVLLSDSAIDWTLFSELATVRYGWPSWTRSNNVVGRLIQHHVENGRHWQAFLEGIEKYHLRVGIRHHALIDARGLKSAYFNSLRASESQ